jgi:translation initiation factor 2B subunit (eIF-2B alpha/beta/delta family)
MNETVNHPSHYGGGDNPYEAIKVIEAWELGFCLGNSVKYIARAGKKKVTESADPRASEIEDLKKARWYIERRIQQLEAAASPQYRVETESIQ